MNLEIEKRSSSREMQRCSIFSDRRSSFAVFSSSAIVMAVTGFPTTSVMHFLSKIASTHEMHLSKIPKKYDVPNNSWSQHKRKHDGKTAYRKGNYICPSFCKGSDICSAHVQTGTRNTTVSTRFIKGTPVTACVRCTHVSISATLSGRRREALISGITVHV